MCDFVECCNCCADTCHGCCQECSQCANDCDGCTSRKKKYASVDTKIPPVPLEMNRDAPLTF